MFIYNTSLNSLSYRLNIITHHHRFPDQLKFQLNNDADLTSKKTGKEYWKIGPKIFNNELPGENFSTFLHSL